MNQLERDLKRRIQERLFTVVGDAFDLYEMADLDAKDAGAAISHELLVAFVKVCLFVNDGIPPTKQTVEIIATAITQLFELERRKMKTERTQT